MTGLTHLDENGAARMVDVGGKAETARSATAKGRIAMSAAALAAVRDGDIPKGDVLAAARDAHEKLECPILLVTRGRHGMTLFERGQKPLHLPVHGSDEAVDVTGAGDTVSATFSLALGAGGSAFEAARLANIAGSLVVQKEGTATVTRAEIEGALGRGA